MLKIFIMLFTTLLLSAAQAQDLFITTEFKPSAANPTNNKFTNTTPLGGICLTMPHVCPGDTFSVATNLIVKNRYLTDQSYSSPRSQDVYLNADARWRDVTLTDTQSGRSFIARFRLTLISQKFVATSGITHDNNYFNNAATSPEGGCGGTDASETSQSYEFAWKLPESLNICNKPVVNLNSIYYNIEDISIGYEIQTNSPMTLGNGDYEGTVVYVIGENQDLDFGRAMGYTDNELKIHINAHIEHEFKIEMTGSNKINMEPDGGWAAWSSSGDHDVELKGKKEFSTTASAPFSVYLDCQYVVFGNACAMQMDGTQDKVPVDIKLTIPNTQNALSGDWVTGMNVPVKDNNIPDFVMQPQAYLNGALSRVDFLITLSSVRTMAQHLGSTWRGSATLVFDADLPFAPSP